MVGKILSVLVWLLCLPGIPFTHLLSHYKQMGDGTGNESGMISKMMWSLVFGVIIWVSTMIGVLWVVHHFTLSMH